MKNFIAIEYCINYKNNKTEYIHGKPLKCLIGHWAKRMNKEILIVAHKIFRESFLENIDSTYVFNIFGNFLPYINKLILKAIAYGINSRKW